MKPAIPTPDDINHTLREIERTELSDDHPRRLAQEAIAKWKSNAEREGLPVVNRRDNKGAEPLNVDEVLRRSEPNHVRSK